MGQPRGLENHQIINIEEEFEIEAVR